MECFQRATDDVNLSAIKTATEAIVTDNSDRSIINRSKIIQNEVLLTIAGDTTSLDGKITVVIRLKNEKDQLQLQLAANSGVDIGDVDVVYTRSMATNLVKQKMAFKWF